MTPNRNSAEIALPLRLVELYLGPVELFLRLLDGVDLHSLLLPPLGEGLDFILVRAEVGLELLAPLSAGDVLLLSQTLELDLDRHYLLVEPHNIVWLALLL